MTSDEPPFSGSDNRGNAADEVDLMAADDQGIDDMIDQDDDGDTESENDYMSE